jgi:uncharacterized protein (TIGR03435 family)
MVPWWFLLGFLFAASALAADPPSPAHPIETKLRKLEMRRFSRDPRAGINGPNLTNLCRSRKRSGGGDCWSGLMRHLLEFAFNNDAHRIFGPQWMQDDDLYMFYFEYDVDGECPKSGRSLSREIFREILVEEFSLTVRDEEREAPVIVMRVRAGQPLTAASTKDSCSIEGALVYSDPKPAEVGGLATIEWNGQTAYPAGQPYTGQSDDTVREYRGCTTTELAHLLESRLHTDVVDETVSAGRHVFVLKNGTPEEVALQLSKQLGIDARVEKRPMRFVSLDGPRPPKKIQLKAKGSVSPVPCATP